MNQGKEFEKTVLDKRHLSPPMGEKAISKCRYSARWGLSDRAERVQNGGIDPKEKLNLGMK